MQNGLSGLGLEAQQEAVRAHAARAVLTIIQSFTEIETGTRKRERIEIHKAIAAARAHGAVLLWSWRGLNGHKSLTQAASLSKPWASKSLGH